MATTGAPANIPLFDDNSVMTPIQAPFNAIATALNNYLKTKDTGWVGIDTPSGFSPSGFSYRVLGGVTYFKGNIAINSGSFPNGYTNVGTVPAGARPNQMVRAPIGFYNGITGLLVIQTDGSIQVGCSTSVGTGDTVYVGGVSYPADR